MNDGDMNEGFARLKESNMKSRKHPRHPGNASPAGDHDHTALESRTPSALPAARLPGAKPSGRERDQAKAERIKRCGRLMTLPCKECKRKMKRGTGVIQCISFPAEGIKCNGCILSHRNCVYEETNDDERSFRNSVSKSVPKRARSGNKKKAAEAKPASSSSFFPVVEVPQYYISAAASTAAPMPAAPPAPLPATRTPLPSMVPVVQEDFWVKLTTNHGQPRNETVEVEGTRYPKCSVMLDGKLVECAILVPLEEVTTGIYQMKKEEKRVREMGANGEGGGREERRAKRLRERELEKKLNLEWDGFVRR